jgi:hypothetical protein
MRAPRPGPPHQPPPGIPVGQPLASTTSYCSRFRASIITY